MADTYLDRLHIAIGRYVSVNNILQVEILLADTLCFDLLAKYLDRLHMLIGRYFLVLYASGQTSHVNWQILKKSNPSRYVSANEACPYIWTFNEYMPADSCGQQLAGECLV